MSQNPNYIKLFPWRRLAKILQYAVAGFISTLFAILFSIFLILWRGPIDLTFLKPHLQKAVSLFVSQPTLEFKMLRLKWAGLETPFVLEVKDLHLQSADPREPLQELDLPQARLKFRMTQLFTLSYFPRDSFVQNLKVRYKIQEAPTGQQTSSLQQALSRSFKAFKRVASFKRLEVEHASLDLIHQGKTAHYDIQGMLKRKRHRLTAQADVQGDHGLGSLHLEGNLDEKTLRFHLAVPELSGALLAFVDQKLGLADYDLDRLRVSGHGLYHLKNGLQELQVEGAITNFKAKAQAGFPKDILVSEIPFKIQGTATDLIAHIDHISLASAAAHLHLHGQWQHGGLNVAVQLDAEHLALADLALLWPQGAATPARSWITQNMPSGKISLGKVLVHGHMPSDGAFQVHQLTGRLDLEDAQLKYVETMPSIENLKAVVQFTKTGFDIEVLNGVCQNLTVQSGHVLIPDILEDTTHLSLDVNLAGAFADVLRLIDAPPLGYAKLYKLNPQKAKGDVSACLQMRFPLTDPFDTSKIETRCKASISRAQATQVLGLPIDLKDGALEVAFDEDKLLVKGPALLNNAPANIAYERFTKAQQGSLQDRACIDVKLTPQSLEFLGVNINSFMQGGAPTTIRFQQLVGANTAQLQMTSDLTPAQISAFHYTKPIHQKAAFKADMVITDGHICTVNNFEMISKPHIRLIGSCHFDPQTSALKDLQLVQAKFGATDFTGHITKGEKKYEAVLTAHHLNLQDFLEDEAFMDSLQNTSHNAAAVHLTATINHLRLGGPRDLLNVTVNALHEQGRIAHLRATAHVSGVPSPQNKVTADIFSKGHNLRKFRLKTNAAGSFFQALNLFENVEGGKFRFVAFHDDFAPRSPWEGTAILKNFALHKVPALTRFMSLVFPTGLADLVHSNALSFQYLKTRFILTPKDFMITAGRAYGLSSGFSFSGQVQRRPKGNLKINGSMIPAYFLNTLVSKIPLIGAIISGGKHEGLVGVSFQMTGPKDDPKTSVNPLSAFTPGFLRKFFSVLDDERASQEDLGEDTADPSGEKDKDLDTDLD